MRIYTKKGDFGMTALANGLTVPKNDARIAACGELDEVNALIGICRIYVAKKKHAAMLESVQNSLFEAGAKLAESVRAAERQQLNTEEMEKWIDEIEDKNEELKNFVLPGGAKSAAFLHQTRAVCRRAERSLVAAEAAGDVLKYVNRLSDLLFVMARRENGLQGVAEYIWKA